MARKHRRRAAQKERRARFRLARRIERKRSEQLGAAEVRAHGGAAPERRALLGQRTETHAHARARRELRCGEHFTAADLRNIDAGQIRRDAHAAGDAIFFFTEHLQRAHAHVATAGLQHERIADRDASLHQRSRYDRAVTGEREDAIDRQERRRVRRARRQRHERIVNRGAQLVHPFPAAGRDADHRRAGSDRSRDRIADERAREFALLCIDQIDFTEHDDRAANVEIAEDREVLERLRCRPFVRGDDEQQQLHPGSAREHVVQESLVAGNVDDPGLDTVGEAQVGEAEIERHPAYALFEPAIGIGSGQGANERRFAVIDMTRGSDDVHGLRSTRECRRDRRRARTGSCAGRPQRDHLRCARSAAA